jgi:hypothetical protein
MSTFTIESHHRLDGDADDAQPLTIRLGETVFTRLIRPGHEKIEDSLEIPPGRLAYWMLDNWWRLRYECLPPKTLTPQWRLSHDMDSIGGGFAWPRLRIWGEGTRVGLSSKSDPEGVVGPVRFLTDALFFIAGDNFEGAIDKFLTYVADQKSGFGSDREALRTLVGALRSERSDPEITQWRRLEAQMGFDPDQAPEWLIREVGKFSVQYGSTGIEEAVQAHPGIDAAKVLTREIKVTSDSGWDCDFTSVIRLAGSPTFDEMLPPWRIAEEVAQRVRQSIGVTSGLIDDTALADLADVSPHALESVRGDQLEYGLRLGTRTPRSKLSFHTRAATSRRFELGRAIGDAIWGQDVIGPLASSKTARQKFQRSFAQNLLCPFHELMGFLQTSNPTDDDMADAAQYFDVSEKVIRTTLMNNDVLERDFQGSVEAA